MGHEGQRVEQRHVHGAAECERNHRGGIETVQVRIGTGRVALVDAPQADAAPAPYKVIRNLEGETLAGPRYWFEPALKQSKIYKFSWHCLRHTFASRLVMAGVDIRTVQELMGHKSISMTVRYSHLAPKHTLAAVELLIGSPAAQPTGTKTSTEPIGQKREEVAHVH